MAEFNFAVRNEFWSQGMEDFLFSRDVDPNQHIQPLFTQDMFDILVGIGVFKSKSEARKNWRGSEQAIPPGFNSFVVGKLKHKLFIWNPVKDN